MAFRTGSQAPRNQDGHERKYLKSLCLSFCFWRVWMFQLQFPLMWHLGRWLGGWSWFIRVIRARYLHGPRRRAGEASWDKKRTAVGTVSWDRVPPEIGVRIHNPKGFAIYNMVPSSVSPPPPSPPPWVGSPGSSPNSLPFAKFQLRIC